MYTIRNRYTREGCVNKSSLKERSGYLEVIRYMERRDEGKLIKNIYRADVGEVRGGDLSKKKKKSRGMGLGTL